MDLCILNFFDLNRPTLFSHSGPMSSTYKYCSLCADDSLADLLIHGPVNSSRKQKSVTNPLLPGAPKLTNFAKPEHEWALRGGIKNVKAEFDHLRPHLAMTHSFELDTFQKEAVLHLEKVSHWLCWQLISYIHKLKIL